MIASKRLSGFAALLLGVLLATPAIAQEEPRFCPNRPDLGSGACTTLPGQVHVELSVLDWQRDEDAETREDQLIAGDVLLRIGLGSTTEVQLGWTAAGSVRTRTLASGAVSRDAGTGDVMIGLRQNLKNPDGQGLSIALEPSVTLPTGGDAIGAGTWSAAMTVPVGLELNNDWALAFTGTVGAVADSDGEGRHSAFGAILGLQRSLGDTVTLVGELAANREDEPGERRTETFAAASVAWRPVQRVQLDLLAVVGLNRDSPDVRLVTGGAFLF